MDVVFVFEGYCDHRDLHVLTNSFPTRRSSVLRHLLQLGALGRPPAPLTGDNLELVRPVRVAADQDRLQDALRLDRFRERIDRRLVEVVTRLESAWAQVLDGHGLARADLVERGVVLVLLAEEGGETAAEIGALALVRWWPVNHGTSRPLPAPAYCAS